MYNQDENWTFFSDIISGEFKRTVKKPTRKGRGNASFTNFNDRHIIFSGGYCPAESAYSSSVSIYSIEGDRWADVPAMNERRASHGTCIVADYLYAACGDDGINYLNSVERINIRAITDGAPDIFWEVLTFYG